MIIKIDMHFLSYFFMLLKQICILILLLSAFLTSVISRVFSVSAGDGEYMLRCPLCNKGFTRTYLLQEHIRSSHSDKVTKHPCPKCDESFALKSQLEKHLSLHSTTSQICTICNKTFANVYRLQRHMISHDESTDLRKFKCPECGKAFKFKHHLKEHIRIHSGEKPFECSNCGKRFSHSGSYSSHMTSKKCWVVNMRMKKPDKQQDDQRPQSNEENLRPLAPKGDDNGVDLSVQNMYASQFGQFLPLDPTTAAQYLAAAQFNGTRPFLPYPGFPSHMINPMIPGMAGSPYGFALLSDKKDQLMKSVDKNGELPLHKSMKLETVPVKDEQKADENQNTQTSQESSQQESEMTPEDGSTAVTQIKQEKLDSEETQKDGEKQEKSSGDEEEKASRSGGEETKSENQETEEGKVNPKCDMNAIKEVLEILNATVSKQQQEKDDKSAISKLNSASDEEKSKENMEGSSSDDVPKGSMHCRYCKGTFESPVDLHQHERYLCKSNADIPPSDRSRSPSEQKDTSHSTADVANGNSTTKSIGTASPSPSQTETEKGSEDENCSGTGDNDGFMDKEGRQYRVRSMLTDEQQRILKAHYAVNPRPNKFELLQIANAVSFPKRVVQVWFQNMRARDRRRGNPIPPSSSSSSSTSFVSGTPKLTNGSTWSGNKTPSSTPYIPVVPQIPFSSVVANSSSLVFPYANSNSKINGQLPPSVSSSPQVSPSPANVAFTMQVEPLDLSTKKSTTSPTSQSSSSSTSSPPISPASPPVEEGGVLNLSKRTNTTHQSVTNTDIPSLEKSLENSPIFKYMQQEGMLPSNGSTAGSDGGNHSNKSTPSIHPPLVRPGSVSLTNPQGLDSIPTESAVFPVPTSMPNHASPHLHRSSPLLPLGSPSTCTSPPSSLESSFNSTMSLDSVGLENGLSKKRSRKKSWRQVGLPVSTRQHGRCFSSFVAHSSWYIIPTHQH